ncbi:MAG TPA: amidohydrolase family protein [Fimbriimonadaceae bacterium]|nr:amidohydrolase family protein [Fimbriimonadaceae bacterium]
MTGLLLALVSLQNPTVKPPAVPAPAQVPQFPVELEADRTPALKVKGDVLIAHGLLQTVSHGVLKDTDILVQHGKITQIGKGLSAPAGTPTIDATGLIVTPGIIDSHSHRAEDETNEGTDSITAEVEIERVLNSSLPSLYTALACGITTSMVLHGSANAIGGQSIVIKNKWKHPVEELPFPGAPHMIKFALGENPTGANGGRGRYPQTRMGVESIYRRAFADAKGYAAKWAAYRANPGKEAPPRRDLRLEAIADILNGHTWVQCHSYRQDEMLMMLRLSQEFHFHLVLQHALEAYKIAPELAAAGVGVSMFGNGFTYKVEVVDSAPLATAIVDRAGVTVAVNTDTFAGTVPLTQDAGRAVRYGMSPDHALRMLTINPAKELGVDRMVGSLELGKDADIAIWQGDPLSVYSKCQYTLIDGELLFQRRDVFKVDGRSAASPGLVAKTYAPETWTTPKSSGAYLIHGATVHPMSGPAMPNTSVLIVDGKIAVVGGSPKLPAGVVQVDGKGLHVYPGLIDAGSTLGLEEIGSVRATNDHAESGEFRPDLIALHSVNPESVHIPETRMNGVTSSYVRSTGGSISGQGSIMSLSGYTTEQLGTVTLAGLDVNVPAPLSGEFVSFLPPEIVAQQNGQIKARVQAVRDFFSAAKRYLAAKEAGDPPPFDTKYEAMAPYLAGKGLVVFHASGAGQIRTALAIAKDFGLKAAIAGGQESWRVAKLLAERRVPVILDAPATSCPGETNPADPLDPYDSPYAVAALLFDAGVKFCFEGGNAEEAMDLPYGVGRMCAFGLPHEVALKALTADAASILGVGDRLGTLEPGKTANVIVTDGDPLEQTTLVRYLFIGGKPVPLTSHYTELWKKYTARL